jgi:AcrR family transcriptional regulator
MPSRQEIRSEETRQAILTAAGQLFTERGFDMVTMREIARAAGCSHTTIYIYFKDKETLLHQLSMGPLQSLFQRLEAAAMGQGLSPDNRLKQMSREFILFCLANRTLYTVFFMSRGSRVDEESPALEIQRLRNQMFSLLRQAIQACLPPGQTDEQILAYARILFFALHGIHGTYSASPEELGPLMARLGRTFDLTVAVLLEGFKRTAETGGTL